METLQQVRAKFPQYGDISDADLADALHRKFYSDMPKAQFLDAIGMTYVQPDPPPGVTIHGRKGDGQSEVYKGKNKAGLPVYEPTTMPDARARALRDAGVNSVAGDVADSVVRGIPYAGAFLPRGRALATSALNGTPYADELSAEQARAGTFDKDYPVTSLAGKAAGAVGSAVAASPVSGLGMLFGFGAQSVPGAIARGGIAGGLQGTAQGLGETKDITAKQAISDALMGGGFGAALGAGATAALSGAGSIVDAVRNRGADALSNLSRGAQKYVGGLLDPAKVQQQKQAIAGLGPDGMLADVSPEWGAIARGSASKPGSRDTIVKALTERDAGKNARLTGAINSEIGPDVVPSQVAAQIKAAKEALSPEYETVFKGAKAVDTKAVADKLETLAIDKRGAAAAAAEDVRKMLNVKGTDVLDPNPRTLHQTRMAIDGMLDGVTDGNVKRVLTEARKAIDEELAAKVPGIKAVDAKYAAISREGQAFKEGQTVFDGGRDTVLRPAELAAKQAELVQPAGSAAGPPTKAALQRLSDGARSEIERIVGTNSNDVSRLNTMLKGEGDWNRDKLRLLFGQDKADRILKVLDAERTMEATKNWVVGNSATAPTAEFTEALKRIEQGNAVSPESTMTGMAVRGVQKLAEALRSNRGKANAEMVAAELGKLSVATGASRDAIIQALLQRGVRASQLQKLYDLSGGASGVATTASPLVQALTGVGPSQRR